MQALKDYAAAFGAIIGVFSGMVTLYAKYLDVRKRRGSESEGEALPAVESPPPARRAPSATAVRPIRLEVADEPPALPSRSEPRPSVANVRELVKYPAIALMVAGALGLAMNILVAGYGYVDAFVTPLSDETKAQVAAGRPIDQNTAAMTIVATFGLSIASAAAIWAGFDMLRLRSYWLSVAGSIAIMPGACVCCFAGVPIGIWSLVVLFRPEVSEAFH
jgi:hypothetical protein